MFLSVYLQVTSLTGSVTSQTINYLIHLREASLYLKLRNCRKTFTKEYQEYHRTSMKTTVWISSLTGLKTTLKTYQITNINIYCLITGPWNCEKENVFVHVINCRFHRFRSSASFFNLNILSFMKLISFHLRYMSINDIFKKAFCSYKYIQSNDDKYLTLVEISFCNVETKYSNLF